MWHHHMWMKMNLFVTGQMFRRVLSYHSDSLYKKQDWKCYGDWTKPALWDILLPSALVRSFLGGQCMDRWVGFRCSVLPIHTCCMRNKLIRQYIPTHVWSCYNLCKACWNWSPFFSWEWSILLVWSPNPLQLKQSQGSKVTSFSLAAAVDSYG